MPTAEHVKGTPTAISETKTWPELAIGLYEVLTQRNAEIAYSFEDFSVEVPSKVGKDAEHALWRVQGTLKIKTQNLAN